MGVSSNQFERLKKSLEQGDISNTLQLLKTVSCAYDLDAVREQKLLLRIHEPEKQLVLVTAYKSAAKHLYPNQEEIEKAERYADFTNILLRLFEKLGNQAAEFRHIFAFLSPLELFELMDEAIVEFVTHTSDSHWGELKRETESKALSTSELTDLSEWVTHRHHGALNDIGFAGARVLNWLIQFTNSSKRVTNKQSHSEKQERLYSTARKSLHVLLHIASNWNSLEYAADKVSYGEWFITKIRDTDPLEIEFSFSDISLAHANEIGLRREIIGLYRGKKEPRWMQEYLEGFALSATTSAIKFYVSNSRPPSFSQRIFTELKPRILELLGFLDAEDELLLAAAKDDFSVLAQYLATIALFCFTVTSRFVKQQSGKNINKHLTCPIIPIETIISLIVGKNQYIRSAAREAVLSQLISLPTSRYLDICHTPYIQLPRNQVVALVAIFNGNWPPVVRSNLVKGGPLAESYGGIWEEFIKHSMTDFGWNILERGRKIKRNKKVLTDIDVIALKDGLLLLIQIKAIAAGAFNKYDYWKARKTLIKGTEQALIAEQEIRDNPSLLSSILSNNQIQQKVERIQPLVLTTSPLFTGWSYNNVPVISTGYLMSLLRGAKAKYVRGDGAIIGEKRFTKGNELTTDEFLEYLHDPWDWQIAKESDKVEHMWVELEDIKLAFPLLQRDRIL